MQPRAHWWRSFCARIRSTPRGAMRRSYSLRSVRESIFMPIASTLQRFREQPPHMLAERCGHGERQLLPHPRRQIEAVLLALERRHAARRAEHVLVVERDRLRPPLLLETERSGIPLAAPHVERRGPARDAPLDRFPIEH